MDAHVPGERTSPADWPRWTLVLLVPGPLLAWHDALARVLATSAPPATAHAAAASALLPWLGTALAGAAALAETLLYGMLWRARGRTLRVPETAVTLLNLSVLELVAERLVAPGGGAWRAWLAGARATWTGAPPGALAAAFGSAGVLTGLRVVLAATVQAAGSGARVREGLAMVGVGWLVSHVVLAWSLAMVWGRSVMP